MKTALRLIATLCLLATLFLTAACAQVDKTGAWESAIHLSDKSFGNGATTVTVEVSAEDEYALELGVTPLSHALRSFLVSKLFKSSFFVIMFIFNNLLSLSKIIDIFLRFIHQKY